MLFGNPATPSPSRAHGRSGRTADSDAYSRRAAVFVLVIFLFTGFVVKIERTVLASVLVPQARAPSEKASSGGRPGRVDLLWQRLFGSAPAVVNTRGLRKPSSVSFNDSRDLIPQEDEPACKALPDESHQVTTRGLPPCPSSHQDFPMWAILLVQPTKCGTATFTAFLCWPAMSSHSGRCRQAPPDRQAAPSLTSLLRAAPAG